MTYAVDARPTASGDAVTLRVTGENGGLVTHIPTGALEQAIAALQRCRVTLPVHAHLAQHEALGAKNTEGRV